LAVVFCLVVCSGNLLAQERKSGEFSLGGAISGGIREGPAFLGVFSIGYYDTIGFEFGGLFVPSAGGILSANFVLSASNHKEPIYYVIGGVWTITSDGTGWNIGGGLKMKLNEKLAIRIEYRRWVPFGESEGGGYSLSCGLSLFF
jgi:hypothetical protein